MVRKAATKTLLSKTTPSLAPRKPISRNAVAFAARICAFSSSRSLSTSFTVLAARIPIPMADAAKGFAAIAAKTDSKADPSFGRDETAKAATTILNSYILSESTTIAFAVKEKILKLSSSSPKN
jgi:hypothetical protein